MQKRKYHPKVSDILYPPMHMDADNLVSENLLYYFEINP